MVPAEKNGDLQTLICVLVARPRRCPTLSNPVQWQSWMAAYLGYTLQMKTLFRGWPVMVHDTHTRRRRQQCSQRSSLTQWCNARYHTAGSGFNSASGKIFTNFILTFYSLVFTVICSVFAKKTPSRTYVSVNNIRHFRKDAKTGNQNEKMVFQN